MKATMKFNHLHRWIVIFATAVLVAACGFHLRGNYDFPFTSLYIDFPAASQTASILKRQITAMNLTKIVNNPQEAEVIAVGPGTEEVKMEVKNGDKVIYSKYAGTEVKLDGEEYIVVKQSDILAIVE